MVAVVVRHDQRIEPIDPLAAEVGNNDAAARVRHGVERRSGVVEQRVPLGAREHRKPLAHVEHGDP